VARTLLQTSTAVFKRCVAFKDDSEKVVAAEQPFCSIVVQRTPREEQLNEVLGSRYFDSATDQKELFRIV